MTWGLDHAAFDLSLEERVKLKIAEVNLASVAHRLGQGEDGVQLRNTLTRFLFEFIRERSWCVCLLDCCVRFDSQSTLCLVGFDQTAALAGIPTRLRARGWAFRLGRSATARAWRWRHPPSSDPA